MILFLTQFLIHVINFRCGGSFADSPDWIKKKKAAINAKIKMVKVVTVAFNYGEIESH